MTDLNTHIRSTSQRGQIKGKASSALTQAADPLTWPGILGGEAESRVEGGIRGGEVESWLDGGILGGCRSNLRYFTYFPAFKVVIRSEMWLMVWTSSSPCLRVLSDASM